MVEISYPLSELPVFFLYVFFCNYVFSFAVTRATPKKILQWIHQYLNKTFLSHCPRSFCINFSTSSPPFPTSLYTQFTRHSFHTLPHFTIPPTPSDYNPLITPIHTRNPTPDLTPPLSLSTHPPRLPSSARHPSTGTSSQPTPYLHPHSVHHSLTTTTRTVPLSTNHLPHTLKQASSVHFSLYASPERRTQKNIVKWAPHRHITKARILCWRLESCSGGPYLRPLLNYCWKSLLEACVEGSYRKSVLRPVLENCVGGSCSMEACGRGQCWSDFKSVLEETVHKILGS